MWFCNVLLDFLCKMILFKWHFSFKWLSSVPFSFSNLISSIEDGSYIPFSIHFTEFSWELNKVMMWKIFYKYKLETLSIFFMILSATCGKSLLKFMHQRSGISCPACLFVSYLKKVWQMLIMYSEWTKEIIRGNSSNIDTKSLSQVFFGASVVVCRTLPP